MEDLRIRFIDEFYNDAITLKEKFKITESKEWNVITVLLELSVQIGHIFDIKCNNQGLKELMRNINNLGDEISDVLLQTMYLGYMEKIDFKEKQILFNLCMGNSFKIEELDTKKKYPVIRQNLFYSI